MSPGNKPNPGLDRNDPTVLQDQTVHPDSGGNTKTNAGPNVDAHEIHKFEELAHRWWDTGSEFKPLHDINPLRLNFIDRQCKGLKDKRVIDVGCGGGILAESMALKGATTTGIDMGEAPLSVAELHALDTGVSVTYRHITAEAMAAEQASQFDVVTCMEMLEHVPDPGSVIRACAEMVRPGGDVFFSTINRNPKAFLLAIVGAEYVLNLLPRGTHEYAKFIRPSELDEWAREAGLQLESIKGMTYNPLLQIYRLGDDVGVNYLVHYRKPL